MDILSFSYFIIILLLNIIMVSGFYLLFKHINYAYNDACVLFADAESIRNLVCYKRNYVIKTADMCQEFGMETKLNYNLFLNIIRLFPAEKRLRGTQLFNLAVYALFLGMMFLLLLKILFSYGVAFNPAFFISILFVLLMGARTKVMFVVTFPQSEIINYLLFMISAYLAWHLTSNPSYMIGFGIGVTSGLAYRNRFTDIILIFTCLTYLFILNTDWAMKIIYCSGVLLANIESIYLKINGKTNLLYNFKSVWISNVPMYGADSQGRFIFRAISAISHGLKKMLSFYSEGSFWPSMGSALLLFPMSVFYLFRHGLLNGVFVFFLIYLAGYCFVTLFIRRNQVDGASGTCYFGGRQVYILFPILFIFNAFAFTVIYLNRNYVLLSIYAIFIFFYIVHQGYRVLSYYFSDSLSENEYQVYRKKNFSYMLEVAEFIKKASKPMVVMGYALYNDEAHNFYNWSRDVRSVNVRVRIDDSQALGIIEKYQVTHIIITPISYFIGEQCSLDSKNLGPLLKDKLERKDLSSQVIVYDVI